MDKRLKKNDLGYWQVSDMPTQEQLQKFYAEHYFQTNQGPYRSSYEADEIEWFYIRIARVAASVAEIRKGKKGSLLDVGCGEGFALDWFLKDGWNVTGLDYSTAGMTAINPHMLPYLKAGDMMENLVNLGNSNQKFDLVWLTNVLEHVPEPLELLKNLRKVVAKDGVAVVTLPNDGTYWQEFLYENKIIPERTWIAIPDHLVYFDKDSLRKTCEAAGWNCKHIYAEFPIDWYLANSHSNYYTDRSKGKAAHAARIMMDKVLSHSPVADVNNFFEAMANIGMGRQMTAILV